MSGNEERKLTYNKKVLMEADLAFFARSKAYLYITDPMMDAIIDTTGE